MGSIKIDDLKSSIITTTTKNMSEMYLETCHRDNNNKIIELEIQLGKLRDYIQNNAPYTLIMDAYKYLQSQINDLTKYINTKSEKEFINGIAKKAEELFYRYEKNNDIIIK